VNGESFVGYNAAINTSLVAWSFGSFERIGSDKSRFERIIFEWQRLKLVKILSIFIANRQKMSDIDSIISTLTQFRDERDWSQFHNPKDLAVAISVEAGELLELFLWKDPEDVKKEKVREELADVFAFAFFLAEKYGFDVKQMVMEKMEANARKYPVDKSKGTAKKYNEL
jgi:NTP pyrophosphatase (non-canonical NTP hydrolase)